MASTAQAHARRLALDDLPREVVDRILVLLPPRDLASLNATARLFHAAPPGGCSAVERALRERARARGHERTLPASLPSGVRTWVEELFAREHTLALARAHAAVVNADMGYSAFVDAEGGLRVCGVEEDEHRRWAYRPHACLSHSGMLAVHVPTRVPSLSAVRVVAVAGGGWHTLALSDAGAVYGCGHNGCGQLGLGDTDERRSFAPVKLPARETVVGIWAGYQHSLALTAAGCAYSWGRNGSGQLGLGDQKERREPTRIAALGGVRVGGIAAAGSHTLLLSNSGAVYSCGECEGGRLGHSDQRAQRDQRTPRRIKALAAVRAVHVSAGLLHSLVVDNEGAVYSFGYGELGRLGYGDTREQLTPKRIVRLAGVRIVRACAGVATSAVLGADGSVHTFGDNWFDQLGHGHRRKTSAIPRRVGALAQTRVVHCALGMAHSLFVSADGNVYVCGKQSAALGLGLSSELERDDAPAERIATPVCVETAWRVHVC